MAGRQARAGENVPRTAKPGLTSCRRRPLGSNVVRKTGIHTMERFISAVERSLETENWYSALYLSLTLPDICARLEADNGKTNRAKFVSWYEAYMADKYRHQIGANRKIHTFLSGNDFYALRCAMLHEGGAEITNQECRETLEKFHFTVVGAHCNQINNTLQLDVPTFCRHVCESVSHWYQQFPANHPNKIGRFEQLVKVYVGAHNMGVGIRFG